MAPQEWLILIFAYFPPLGCEYRYPKPLTISQPDNSPGEDELPGFSAEECPEARMYGEMDGSWWNMPYF